MKRKRKLNNADDPPLTPLTTDHFDLKMERLEDLYLKSIKKDVDSIEKSISKMKVCIEIVSVAIAGAVIIYIITTLLSFFGIP